MTRKVKDRRDAFKFSLAGMNTISSFTVAPVVADDRINKIQDERLRRDQEDQPDTAGQNGVRWGRFWLRRRRAAAQC